ncbi:bile acid:sodium symporter family protein [Chelativorans sp. ZYF759]|uniref:bile acid:sodium symporter family protein n=1 Tax=Chelativorans sp. ZYF759 TaxID=2692213 RepID=UPI00145E26C7|nr:bile acid:sodium symporter family protein [Chelativorans sp. ZYF759]NMG40752.1 bile acid:sodium symporter family protein [Chelativorans sp. ZYF759]
MDILFSAFFTLALVVIMFSLGLSLRVGDFARIFRFPKAFAVGLAAQLILIPTTAYIVGRVSGLSPPLALGLMILSFCPGGPTSNMMTKLAHGDVALSISLTGVTSLVTVFTLPILLKLFADQLLGVSAAAIDVAGLGVRLFVSMTIPVMAGIALRHYAEPLASRIEKHAFRGALGFFIIVVVGALAVNWGTFIANLGRLGPSVVGLNILLLVLGFGIAKLFALNDAQATAIAIETGIQNAALGITVGSLIVERTMELPPFSLPSGVYGITMYFVSLPFVYWLRSRMLRGSHI